MTTRLVACPYCDGVDALCNECGGQLVTPKQADEIRRHTADPPECTACGELCRVDHRGYAVIIHAPGRDEPFCSEECVEDHDAACDALDAERVQHANLFARREQC